VQGIVTPVDPVGENFILSEATAQLLSRDDGDHARTHAFCGSMPSEFGRHQIRSEIPCDEETARMKGVVRCRFWRSYWRKKLKRT
jgi:hypothetical protein